MSNNIVVCTNVYMHMYMNMHAWIGCITCNHHSISCCNFKVGKRCGKYSQLFVPHVVAVVQPPFSQKRLPQHCPCPESSNFVSLITSRQAGKSPV